jgi:hypothetical protein
LVRARGVAVIDASRPEEWPFGPHGHPVDLVDGLFSGRLAEFALEPGLVAAVDQHAAMLRDTVGADREQLADYVLGFTDALRDLGWIEPVGYDFATLRLTSVCWFARNYGLVADGDVV